MVVALERALGSGCINSWSDLLFWLLKFDIRDTLLMQAVYVGPVSACNNIIKLTWCKCMHLTRQESVNPDLFL